MSLQKHNLNQEFVVIAPDDKATPRPLTADFYQALDRDFNLFKQHQLISTHQFDCDWNMWERHPYGDEVVLLLNGTVTLIIEHNHQNQFVELNQAGDYVLVPQGLWHTVKTNQLSQLLFITPGEATEHKPLQTSATGIY
ncbi:cupin domain-containing protein [Neptunicella marina]|uniref:Cupin domain-containing protein n=1 Tax=Neptunicella marina TaxID=2125989 RepID=A0A8J6M0W9_9ALTE|nr:cupin domain-containing protein [Neptunicella marina]MBC3765097.1 cupin domain-containing protein [Neptunicella marina]